MSETEDEAAWRETVRQPATREELIDVIFTDKLHVLIGG
jgi:hypothetical protein